MDILKTLQALNACHGPSGDEGDVATFLEKLAAPYVDECHTDTMGNLIAHKKGNGSRVMFAAHMDSIGCVVTHIEKEGFVRFGKVGGLETASILHTPVRFKTGVRGLISLDEKVKASEMKLDDLYLDIGAKSADEARAMVQIGDTAVFDTPSFATGDRLVSPYLDNRISCLVLLMAMEQCTASGNDLYFVFTTQEEVGLRGAKTAAFAIDPDYAVVVDVTVAGDELGSKHEGSSSLGCGAAIKVMDSSVICHPQMVKKLDELARARGIQAQMDVISSGGTDGGSIHTTRMGVLTGGVSVPCRYIHTPTEMVDRHDVEACSKLIAAVIETRL
ncbi:MAG: M42 family metallopeptidase [Intestinimonas sp.]|jgi:endoglucanase|nr:M42 family metallopeptidase [Intestinimonas sp.]